MRFSTFVAATLPALASADFYLVKQECEQSPDSDYGANTADYYFQFDTNEDKCKSDALAWKDETADYRNYEGYNPCNGDTQDDVTQGGDELTLNDNHDGTWDLLARGNSVGSCANMPEGEISADGCGDGDWECSVKFLIHCTTSYCVG